MSEVFGRKIDIVFTGPDGSSIRPSSDLNIGFTVERNLDGEPSTLSATVHNLSLDKAKELQSKVVSYMDPDLIAWKVELLAGYGTAHRIFKGDVRLIRNRREPPLLMTDVEADDGGGASRKLVTRHFPKFTSAVAVMRWLQAQGQLGGDVNRIAVIRKANGLPDRIANGMTIKGYITDEMSDIAKSSRAKISIQDGEVTVLAPGEALPGIPLTIMGPKTGLVGYPSVDTDGIVTLNHRIVPNVVPGAPIRVESEFVNVNAVAERVLYSGSLFEDDFNMEIEARVIE